MIFSFPVLSKVREHYKFLLYWDVACHRVLRLSLCCLGLVLGQPGPLGGGGGARAVIGFPLLGLGLLDCLLDLLSGGRGGASFSSDSGD